ncbi:hypothetical protein WJX84_012125 [Apatococcus fuscideae]|uniref:Mobilization protein n=1 Tax=Apatococcus fuscideae TaxID=2026836 RepID=A0AAW1T5V3_9CHLO
MTSSESNLDQISKDLGDAVKRIEKIQAAEKPPIATRLTNHIRKHGNNLTSLVLAGCLFFVALGRLDLKNSQQAERLRFQQHLSESEKDKQTLKEENIRLAQQLSSLQEGVWQEVTSPVWRFGPVAERLKALLQQESPSLAPNYDQGPAASVTPANGGSQTMI